MFQRWSWWRRQTTAMRVDEAVLKTKSSMEGKWTELTVPKKSRLGTWR